MKKFKEIFCHSRGEFDELVKLLSKSQRCNTRQEQNWRSRTVPVIDFIISDSGGKNYAENMDDGK